MIDRTKMPPGYKLCSRGFGAGPQQIGYGPEYYWQNETLKTVSLDYPKDTYEEPATPPPGYGSFGINRKAVIAAAWEHAEKQKENGKC